MDRPTAPKGKRLGKEACGRKRALRSPPVYQASRGHARTQSWARAQRSPEKALSAGLADQRPHLQAKP